MSDYVQQRLAELRAGTVKRERLIKPRERKSKFQEDPLQHLAYVYVRSERQPDPKRSANWFDVSAAYRAGYEAALVVKNFQRPADRVTGES